MIKNIRKIKDRLLDLDNSMVIDFTHASSIPNHGQYVKDSIDMEGKEDTSANFVMDSIDVV